MSDKRRTTVTTIETHEVWIIRRANARPDRTADLEGRRLKSTKERYKPKEINMKKNFLKTMCGAVLAVSTLAVLPQIWVSAREFGKAELTPKLTEGKGANNPAFLFADGNGCETEECRREVAAARIGTAQYHDLNVALADGFVQDSPCVRRAGVGTMGFHYALAPRIDQIIDPAEPEVLLYLPNDDGV